NIPTTGFANSPIDTNDLIEMVGGAPLIVKLLEGSQGRGVVLAETRKAAESVINAFKALRANLLVQEFIKEAEGKDLRCFVIDGKVVASIQREAAPGEFRANIHQGGTASIIKITPTERKLAVKASKALGLMIAGVDIIRSKHGPLLLEVNSSPGLEGIEAATGKDIAGMMISAIEKKLNWKRELSVKRHK
ncbi:MAG: RimK family alpha-L-glutamate ligase, partial [Gimesia chilikensis]